MNYNLQLRHFDPIRADALKMNVEKTASILALRRGAPPQKDKPAEKTADEHEQFQRRELRIPKWMGRAAEEVLRNRLFTPNYVLNLLSANVENGVLQLHVNYTNYGSLVAMQALVPELPISMMLPIQDQVAALGTRATIYSSSSGAILLGRRRGVYISGKIDVFPAGMADADLSDVYKTIQREALEEVSFAIDPDTIVFIGIGRGLQGDWPNPNVHYLIRTCEGIGSLKSGINEEHDEAYSVYLDADGTALRRLIVNNYVVATPKTHDYDRITSAGLGALLQAGKVLLGNKWYTETVAELHERYPDQVRITKTPDLFA